MPSHDQKLFAGVSETRITPPVGTFLIGPLARSTGVHDELFARALVLSGKKCRVAIVCLDLLGLDFTLVDEIRARIRQQTGITTILLSCTHTHSAPLTVPWSVQGWESFLKEGWPWRTALIEKVTRIVRQAATHPARAILRAGRAAAQVGFNRRLPTRHGIAMSPNFQGAVAPWVDVLRVDRLSGTPIAILFSHAAHPVIIHRASTLISADYPGYAVDRVRHYFPKRTVVMFAQACGGNINAEPWAGGFDAGRHVGTALGEAAAQAAEASQPITGAELGSRSIRITLPFRKFPPLAECKRACQKLERMLARARAKDGSNEAGLWWLRDTVLCLRDLVDRARRREDPGSLPFEATALMTGNQWCLLALNHEIFVEYQLWVETASPFQRTMTWSYTNGWGSYVPTDAAMKLGGYEAGAFPEQACALRRPPRVALKPGVEPLIKNAIMRLWRGIRKKP